MRDYIIINGVNSLSIKGLAITKLPSIYKPIMQTEIEEIDGRNGDIITELGYGAYNKELTVGLFGDYNIDEIIAFFNQKGTIIFSNENDKVYNFDIVDQIEFEKLIKFRSATINIHCQPFKYPLSETPIEVEYEYVTGEGENITLNNTDNSALELDLKGNTSQTGTPTPSSPIPINVVSGDNEINVVGKNLFDKTRLISGKRLDNTGLPSITDNTYCTTDYFIGVKPSTTYYSASAINQSKAVCFYDSNRGFIERKMYLASNAFTTGATTYYIKISILLSEIDTEQLEKGSSVTTYEPYIGNTYNIDLPSGMELCKIGTYQDYIYKDSGKWYLHKEIGKYIFGSTNLAYDSTYNRAYTNVSGIINNILIPTSNNETLNGLSDYFSILNATTFLGNTSLNGLAISSTGTLSLRNTSYTTQTDYNNWLSTNKPILYYVLATPTNTEITYQPLIEQLEALYNAKSKNNETNISQINNDLPFIISASALKKGSDTASIVNDGNIYSKPLIDIEGTGFVTIYLDNAQMFQVDLSELNSITIDTELLEAYSDTQLANRKVVGDYSKFKLQVGTSQLKFGGTLTKATITRYKRWL